MLLFAMGAEAANVHLGHERSGHEDRARRESEKIGVAPGGRCFYGKSLGEGLESLHRKSLRSCTAIEVNRWTGGEGVSCAA